MLDNLLSFSSAQAVTVTAPSTNVIDMLVNRDIGAGNALMIEARVNTAFTAAGAATLVCSWQGSTDNATFYDLILSPVIPVADLLVGYPVLKLVVPPRSFLLINATSLDPTPGRYFRFNFTVATGPMTAGKIDAWMSAEPDQQQTFNYPRNYTI